MAYNFDNSNSSLVAAALKSLTGLSIISQSEIHNGTNNNATYQNINPLSLHSSYLAGGEVQNNSDDLNPHYSSQGNENINQHDTDCSDYQFVSDTTYSIKESSHICSANNTHEVINFIDSDFLDPMYDCDFTNIVDDIKFMRGSYEYRRPCGWKRIAVKVLNKYGDNAWLGKAAKKGSWRYESDPNEWPVSYHGTDKFNARSIAETGFDITKGKRFKFGYGIYSTPDINVAALFANKFIHNNEVYCLVFQNRVNPQTLNKINTSIGEYWISPQSDDIRPYGICIKKLGKIYP
ncbi:hypothetical protein C1646_661459 [Rhizophagus diaphanus]|nr:hypothetical protein C1646_661459 [Rhizophagus diaphanus] [Rhizophagus sp. MUCL 43196]